MFTDLDSSTKSRPNAPVRQASSSIFAKMRDKREASGSYSRIENFKLCGNLVRTSLDVLDSEEQCWDLCLNESTCIGWTWNPASQECYLNKDLSCGWKYGESFVSGNKLIETCFSYQKDFRNFLSPASTHESVGTKGDCCNLCFGVSWCLAWSYVTSNQSCYLMSQVVSGVDDVNGILSGVRFGSCTHLACQNEGHCETNEEYNSGCVCTPGFRGVLCESETIDCNNQCSNSIGCVEGHMAYKCLCKLGFTGQNCTVDIDECISSPCEDDEVCYNGANQYVCTKMSEVAAAKEIILNSLLDEQSTDKDNSKSYEEPIMTHLALSDSTKELSTYLLGSHSDSELSEISFSLEETIGHCRFRTKDCLSQWSMFYHRSYGNCFTYNNILQSQTIANKSGLDYRMQFMTYANPKDYLDTTDTVGMRITFHEPGKRPFPDNDGHNVQPGYVNYFALSHKRLTFLRYPYGRCLIDSSELSVYYYNESYSIQTCQYSFIQERTIDICGCSNPKWPKPADAVTCTPQQKTCADNVSTTTNVGQNCPQSCWVGMYHTQPTKTKMKNGEILKSDMFRGAGKVMIYFTSLSSINIMKIEAYTLSSLLSNLGGIMGLYLGASVISCVELGYTLAAVFCILRKKLNSRMNSEPMKIEN